MGVLEWKPLVRSDRVQESSTQSVSVIPVANNEWLIEALRPVWRLRKLPANWDSYGSAAISDAAVTSAAEILSTLAQISPSVPAAIPVPGGGIQLEWVGPGGELEIECDASGEVSYLSEDKTGEVRDGPINLSDARLIHSLVQDALRAVVPR